MNWSWCGFNLVSVAWNDYSRSSGKRTLSGSWNWPLTGMCKCRACMSCPLTRVSAQRASTVLSIATYITAFFLLVQQFPVPIYTLGWREALRELSVLPRPHNDPTKELTRTANRQQTFQVSPAGCHWENNNTLTMAMIRLLYLPHMTWQSPAGLPVDRRI